MEVLATALEGRAAKRQYWEDRERDKVFKSLPPEARPMPWPNAELHAKTNAWRAAGGEGGGTTGGTTGGFRPPLFPPLLFDQRRSVGSDCLVSATGPTTVHRRRRRRLSVAARRGARCRAARQTVATLVGVRVALRLPFAFAAGPTPPAASAAPGGRVGRVLVRVLLTLVERRLGDGHVDVPLGASGGCVVEVAPPGHRVIVLVPSDAVHVKVAVEWLYAGRAGVGRRWGRGCHGKAAGDVCVIR